VVEACSVRCLVTLMCTSSSVLMRFASFSQSSVSIKTWKASVAEVAAELVANNPGALDSAVLLSRSRC